MKKIFIVLTTLFFICTPLFFAFAADTGGIVNCGKDASGTAQDACTICHLIEGVHRIVKYITGLMVVVAITVITVAGIMYIVSAGGGMVAIAKKAILNTLVGITIVLVAFISITFMLNNMFGASSQVLGAGGLTLDNGWNFSCDKTIVSGGDTSTAPGGGGAASGYPATTQSEKEARDALEQKSGGKISVWESQSGATSISGLRQESVDGVVAFQKEVGAPITVTGAAEAGGPHKSSNTSHANGYKVDIDDTAVVNNYIEKNYTSIPVSKTGRSDISAAYTDGKGNMYYKEGTHWDVCYQCGNAPS